MSKSGLYAHFGSKEELQLATVDTADGDLRGRRPRARSRRTRRAATALIALSDALLRAHPRPGLPGWLLLRLRRPPSCTRTRVPSATPSTTFQDGLAGARPRAPRGRGANAASCRPATDLDQLEFDVLAFQSFAHSLFRIDGDGRVIDHAERAVRASGRLEALGAGGRTVPVRSR